MPKQKQIKKVTPRRTQKEKILLKEVALCLLMPAEEKRFWIDSAPLLPDQALDNAIRLISVKNRVVDKYTRAALAQDKDHIYLAELKAKVDKIKRRAFAIDEESQKAAIEKKLSEELKNL